MNVRPSESPPGGPQAGERPPVGSGTPSRRVGPGSRPAQRSNVAESVRRCADGKPGHPLAEVRVLTRYGNHSAFNGYHFTPSDWSALRCRACGTIWRTNARYVDECRDG